MQQIQQLLQQKKRNGQKNPRLRYEFQAYGQRLAQDLQDFAKETLYMKLAKEVDRTLLEQAREHVLGSEGVRNRGALFMYKLKELRDKKKRMNHSVSDKA
ncbi:MAG: hypothetical protein H6658_11445 [Ardenticatenaceae bacterium]|nr:hypothetical protein [Ardenticatenaceae bacterium]